MQPGSSTEFIWQPARNNFTPCCPHTFHSFLIMGQAAVVFISLIFMVHYLFFFLHLFDYSQYLWYDSLYLIISYFMWFVLLLIYFLNFVIILFYFFSCFAATFYYKRLLSVSSISRTGRRIRMDSITRKDGSRIELQTYTRTSNLTCHKGPEEEGEPLLW